MNESLSQKRSSSSFTNVLIAWVVCFSLGTSWESSSRVLMEYAPWVAGQAFFFIVCNLAFSLLCAVLLAVLHYGLLKVAGLLDKKDFISRKLLWPHIGVAATTLLGICIWVLRYRFPLKQSPMIVQKAFLLVILAPVYLGCMIMARLFHRSVIVKISPRRLMRISIFATIGPILIVLFLPWVSNSYHQGVKRPDSADKVILISVDTLRSDYVSAYGSPYIRTPVIDRIAAEGALFKNAITFMPLTGPSHMSMLTGLPPLVHGVLINGFVLPDEISTVTHHLLRAGYRTGGFVSGWPLQIYNSRLDRGFQRYDDNFTWMDYFDGSFCGRFVSDLGLFNRDLSRDAGPTTDSALKWLAKNVESPFFLFLHYYDPHFPYGGILNSCCRLRAEHEDLPRQKKLYGMEVETVDAQIGRIVSFLKEKGIYDKSLLIFTSDHGENLGEHGHYYEHKSVYDPVIRVPLIVRYPGKVVPGTIITQQVALTDIFQTIMSAAGLESKQTPDSVDLVGLAGGRFSSTHRVMVTDCFRRQVVKHCVRTNEWKLIRNDDLQRTYELYHLSTDPNELMNLYNKEPEIGRQLEPFLNRQLGHQVHREVEGLSPAQIERLKSLGYFN